MGLTIKRRFGETVVFIDRRNGEIIGTEWVDCPSYVRLCYDFPEWVLILRGERARKYVDSNPPRGHNLGEPND